MAQFQSRKWVLFIDSPTSLLKREFLKQCYLYLDKTTKLQISRLLIIGQKDRNWVFVSQKEDRKNIKQIQKYYSQRKVHQHFKKFIGLLEKYKELKGKPIESVMSFWQGVGTFVIYSYFLEKFLMEKYQHFSVFGEKEQNFIKRLLNQDAKLREKISKRGYHEYNKIYPYLKKKFKKFKDFDYYLVDELARGQILPKSELAKRKKLFIELTAKNKTIVYTGQLAKDILKKEEFKKIRVAKNLKALQGISARHGLASGEVIIIKKLADFKKEYKEKIIISPRTVPEYYPYFKKVKAIVTDFGALNSHAAVVARELKIPCIVGTKIATLVFKNGDRVEVDANSGVVQKI